MKAGEKDHALTKKNDTIVNLGIPTWDRAKDSSAFNFIWNKFHRKVSTLNYVDNLEKAAFIHVGFNQELRHRIMKIVSDKCQTFVTNAREVDRRVSAGESLGDGDDNILNRQLTDHKLKMQVYASVAQELQPNCLSLDQDP